MGGGLSKLSISSALCVTDGTGKGAHISGSSGPASRLGSTSTGVGIGGVGCSSATL